MGSAETGDGSKSDRTHPLALAARLLEGTAAEDMGPPEEEAARLLEALDYGVRGEGGVVPDAEPGSRAALNRRALLRLGARLGHVFRLPSPLAPGAIVMGSRCDTGGLPGFSGRGLSHRGAFESCMGEAAEYLSFLRRPEDPLIGPDDTVAALAMPGCVPTRLHADSVLRDPQAHPPLPSAGTGAGASMDAAALSAVLEAVERDALAHWWEDAVPARRLADEALPNELVRRLRRGASRPRDTWALELRTGHGVPVAAALSSASDGSGVLVGAAAGLSLTEAVGSALLELCQMEVACGLALRRQASVGAAALLPTEQLWVRRWRTHHAHETVIFQGAPNGEPAAKDIGSTDPLDEIAARLASVGMQFCLSDITRSDLAIPVVRAAGEGFRDCSGSDKLSPASAGVVAPI